jgi:hypothetical protein
VQQPALFLNRIKPERHGQVNQNPAKLPAKPITFCQNLEVRLPENCRLKKKKVEFAAAQASGRAREEFVLPKIRSWAFFSTLISSLGASFILLFSCFPQRLGDSWPSLYSPPATKGAAFSLLFFFSLRSFPSWFLCARSLRARLSSLRFLLL